MNIVACIKRVPSTEATIEPQPQPPFINTRDLPHVINPFDEYAVEEAIRIKERLAEGEVTLITVGPKRAREILLSSLAMGADKTIHIKDDALLMRDSLSIALILSEVIKRLPYDIILCGKEAVDDRNGAVGIQLAELLDVPHVAVITRLEIEPPAKRAIAHRQIEGGVEVIECPLPAVFTCQKGLNEPSYPSLPGIGFWHAPQCDTARTQD